MNRAVERHNTARFPPIVAERELADTAMREAIEAIADDETALAGSIRAQV
jgi:hypothetical protein